MQSKVKITVLQKVTKNFFFFVTKINKTDPVMVAKLNSKTHLQNTFFYFLSRFVRLWNLFLNFFKCIRNQHKILSFFDTSIEFLQITFL